LTEQQRTRPAAQNVKACRGGALTTQWKRRRMPASRSTSRGNDQCPCRIADAKILQPELHPCNSRGGAASAEKTVDFQTDRGRSADRGVGRSAKALTKT